MAEVKSNKTIFLLGWLMFNLLGWFVGVGACFLKGREILTILYDVPSLSRMPGAIGSVIFLVWLPLGIALGLMQCVHLADWKISFLGWMLATVAGWGIPSILFSLMRMRSIFESSVEDLSPLHNYYKLMWGFLLVVGACVGFFQYLAMKKSMAEPAYWIAANAFGLFAFELLLCGLLRLPLDPSAGFYLPWTVVCIIVPILATITTSLPSGWVLLNYGKKEEAAG